MGFVRRTTYLAEARWHRARSRWRAGLRPPARADGKRAERAVEHVAAASAASAASAACAAGAPAVGLAEVIALAAAGQAKLEVATVGVTWSKAPAMQRWVGLEPAGDGRPPTVAVLVQGG